MPDPLVGRETELAAIDALLKAARGGLRMLVLDGEAGIGKTTMLREATRRGSASGYHVLSSRAAQAEARLSFAGLGDLLETVDAGLFDRLPAPQRHGLEVALLRVAAASDRPPDPRTIGTAVVSLVRELTLDRPVLLALDDAQWLDRPTARVLEFAIRRLEDQPVAVLATTRIGDPGVADELLEAVPAECSCRCRLGPLTLGALYEVLRDTLGQALTRPLLVAIERSSRGNPFYALELARVVAAEKRLPSGGRLPIPEDTRQLVARRLDRLPARARDALLRVSALAHPTLADVDRPSLEPALAAGVILITAAQGIAFTHPLFADAVLARVSPERRRRLHAELATLVTDLEEQARHRSLATSGPDEETADLLDRAASHASARGAPDVAADLGELAAERTPASSAELAERRILRAARDHLRAGDPERARALCERIVTAPGASAVRAEALALLAEPIALESPKAGIPYLEEALACVGNDTRLAAELETSLGYLLTEVGDASAAKLHLDRAGALAERTGDVALLALTTATREETNLEVGLGVDESAVVWALANEDPDRDLPRHLRVPLIAAHIYECIGEIPRARELLVASHARILERGDEADLATVLAQLAGNAYLSGDLRTAEREATEAIRVSVLTRQEIIRGFAHTVRGLVRAVAGDHEGSRADSAEALRVSEGIEWPWGATEARWAQAILALSENDMERAIAALRPVVDMIERQGVYEWSTAMALPDAIEALVGVGELERSNRLIQSLADWGGKMDRPWALALSGRCRALHAAARGELEEAQVAAELALVEHRRLPMPFEQARTLLVLGQVLRRRGQRRAARLAFEDAHVVFEGIGAPRWAEKARTEARRIGVKRAPVDLTENERMVAGLAARGLTNREIAAQMFLSRRTVEANLARAYAKLGIRTRAELGATMAGRGDAVPN